MPASARSWSIDAAAQQILVVAAAGVLLVTAIIVWLTIRRGLRPIDNMIDAAERIAGGDLTARTTPHTPRARSVTCPRR